MKNNSVKFKQSVPRSSNTSVISQFSFESSPMPNAIQFHNFTHAQSISARLSRNSVYNATNIMFNTPRCLVVPQDELLRDDVLAKSPLSRMSQNQALHGSEPLTFTEAVNVSKEQRYTDLTLKRLQRLERFLESQRIKQNKMIRILSLEDTPKKTSDFYQNSNIQMDIESVHHQPAKDMKIPPKINKKFTTLMNNLRIIQKNIHYFTPYDGQFARTYYDLNNYAPLKTSNGLLVNNGRHLTKIQLIADTFKLDQICDNPEKNSLITAFCLADSNINSNLLLAATDSGQLLTWDTVKNHQFEYYALNQDLGGPLLAPAKALCMTQHLQNIYIGTTDNVIFPPYSPQQLLVLDPRLKEKQRLTFSRVQQQFCLSMQQSPLISQQCSPEAVQPYNLDSPVVVPFDVNQVLRETNFHLDEEMETESEPIKLQIPQEQPVRSGINHIDVSDFNVVATLPNGFVHFDVRNPQREQFSYFAEDGRSLRAQFTPNSADNVMYTLENSNKCRVWNVSRNAFLFEKELPSAPCDVIVSNATKEILTLHNDGSNSQIRVYSNHLSKMKYTDEINVSNFNIKKLMLDHKSESLYGIGAYSMRTWNYFSQKEIDIIQQEMQNQLDFLY